MKYKRLTIAERLDLLNKIYVDGVNINDILE